MNLNFKQQMHKINIQTKKLTNLFNIFIDKNIQFTQEDINKYGYDPLKKVNEILTNFWQ